jgi:AraC-like DNA-binding protein
MEVLSDILSSMRVAGSVYFCDRLEAPWSMDFVGRDDASFHLVRRGECWLTTDDATECLGPGDLVFACARLDHRLSSAPPNATDARHRAETLLLCGYCRFDAPLDHPLLSAIPTLTIVREEELLRHAWLKSTLDQLSSECLAQHPGSEVVVNKLTEVVIVELFRINFGRADNAGFVGALFDKPVSRALGLLHAEPQRAWTLDRLAAEVALSRAAFAKRFKERVGQTMFEYLTTLRMQRAQALLRETALPLYDVATRVGYDSDLAFAKAFKRLVGTTPTRYRKSARG